MLFEWSSACLTYFRQKEVAEDKKVFDHEIIKEEENTQPEPDEVLGMNGVPGKVWAVKVRKFSSISLRL